MEEILRDIVTRACGADPQLGADWYELLGKSAPSAEDRQWTELVTRITEVASKAGARTDGFLAALIDQRDSGELQVAIASVVWPQTEAGEPETGTTQPAQGAETIAARMATEDQAAWNTYLRANGATWDGRDESWSAFVTWFLYHADEQGVGASARAFCDYASASDPRQVFAQYGVTIAAPSQAEPAIPATPEMTVDEAVDTFGPDLIAEFRKQNPAMSATSDAELKVMLTQLLSGRTA